MKILEIRTACCDFCGRGWQKCVKGTERPGGENVDICLDCIKTLASEIDE